MEKEIALNLYDLRDAPTYAGGPMRVQHPIESYTPTSGELFLVYGRREGCGINLAPAYTAMEKYFPGSSMKILKKDYNEIRLDGEEGVMGVLSFQKNSLGKNCLNYLNVGRKTPRLMGKKSIIQKILGDNRKECLKNGNPIVLSSGDNLMFENYSLELTRKQLPTLEESFLEEKLENPFAYPDN